MLAQHGTRLSPLVSRRWASTGGLEAIFTEQSSARSTRLNAGKESSSRLLARRSGSPDGGSPASAPARSSFPRGVIGHRSLELPGITGLYNARSSPPPDRHA